MSLYPMPLNFCASFKCDSAHDRVTPNSVMISVTFIPDAAAWIIRSRLVPGVSGRSISATGLPPRSCCDTASSKGMGSTIVALLTEYLPALPPEKSSRKTSSIAKAPRLLSSCT